MDETTLLPCPFERHITDVESLISMANAALGQAVSLATLVNGPRPECATGSLCDKPMQDGFHGRLSDRHETLSHLLSRIASELNEIAGLPKGTAMQGNTSCAPSGYMPKTSPFGY